MWPSGIYIPNPSEDTEGVGKEGLSQSWPGFLEKLRLASKDSDEREGPGELNIGAACIQGRGDRGQRGEAWEKDGADWEHVGTRQKVQKGGSSCWELRPDMMGRVR